MEGETGWTQKCSRGALARFAEGLDVWVKEGRDSLRVSPVPRVDDRANRPEKPEGGGVSGGGTGKSVWAPCICDAWRTSGWGRQEMVGDVRRPGSGEDGKKQGLKSRADEG